MNAKKVIKVLEQIKSDVKNDAKNFDGQSFTGKTVGTYFGNHGAAINALAHILIDIIKENDNNDSDLIIIHDEDDRLMTT